MLKLVIEDDEGRRTAVPLVRSEISIGRTEGNTIRLTERNVSRNHARILRDDDGRIWVEDRSRYGSRKNGRRFAGRTPFDAGDTIVIGDYRLLLGEEAAAQPGPAGPKRPAVPSPDDQKTQALPLAGAAQAAEPEVAEIPEERQGRLVCVSPAFEGAEFRLIHEVMRIGRSDENEVVIDDESVSKTHARITTSGSEVRIQDLGSANGLLVNGESVQNAVLKQGDRVELGSVAFQYVMPGGTFVPAPAPRPAKRSGPAASVATPERPSPALATWDELEEVGGGGGRPAWMMPAAGIAAAAVVVVLFFVLRPSGDDPEDTRAAASPTADAPPAAAAAAAPSDTVSAAAMSEGERYMNAARWEEAVSAFARVAADAEPHENARARSAVAVQEMGHRGIYEDIGTLFESGRAEDALRRINDIPATSYYRTLVRDENLERRILNQVIDGRIARSRDEEASGQRDVARRTVEEMVALAPDDARLAARLAELEGRPAAEAYQRVAEATAARREPAEPVAAAPRPERTERAEREPSSRDRTPEPAAPRREEPARPATVAAAAAPPATAPATRTAAREERAPAPDRAADRARADELRTEAGRLSIRRDHRGAITLLEEAAALNSSDARIFLALHQNYREIGNQNRAARNLRTYLRLQPNAPNRAQYDAWLAENAPE